MQTFNVRNNNDLLVSNSETINWQKQQSVLFNVKNDCVFFSLAFFLTQR